MWRFMTKDELFDAAAQEYAALREQVSFVDWPGYIQFPVPTIRTDIDFTAEIKRGVIFQIRAYHKVADVTEFIRPE